MRPVKAAALAVLTLLLVACGGTGVTAPEQTAGQRPQQALVTEQEAGRRSAAIGAVAYDLSVKLEDTPQTYNGRVEISFDYTPQDRPLTIDFVGGVVETVSANGREVEFDYQGNFISLPARTLDAGRNRGTVEYRRDYNVDGGGIRR